MIAANKKLMGNSAFVKEQNRPLVEMKGIKKSFGNNQVLKGFNLELYPNENVVIVGKSGSGKSVLIKCLVRLIDIDDGEVIVLGKSISELGQKELDQIRTEDGFLFQGCALFSYMTFK